MDFKLTWTSQFQFSGIFCTSHQHAIRPKWHLWALVQRLQWVNQKTPRNIRNQSSHCLDETFFRLKENWPTPQKKTELSILCCVQTIDKSFKKTRNDQRKTGNFSTRISQLIKLKVTIHNTTNNNHHRWKIYVYKLGKFNRISYLRLDIFFSFLTLHVQFRVCCLPFEVFPHTRRREISSRRLARSCVWCVSRLSIKK